MAGLFEIKNITFPTELKTNVPLTITGDLTLFTLPFYALLWVVAKVTYPHEWWEIIGSPITTQTVMATLGKFSITFPKGFDREGGYLLDISAYLGPEKTESAGPVTSVSVEIPPFPPVASLPQANFAVSASGPSDTTGVTIVSYANGTGTPVTAPGNLSLKVGDTCKVNVSFNYNGPATNKTLYAAIGNADTLLGFDEILPGSVQVAVPATTAATPMTKSVSIPVTSAISPGTYSIYAKLDSTESPQLADVITITGVPNSPIYTNVTLKSYDASVNMGDKCKTVLAFDYQGPAHTATVYCAIGKIDTVLLIKTFDEILTASVSKPLPAADTPTHYEVEVDIPVTSAIDPTKSPYSVYGKVDSVESPEIEKVITIVGAAQPTITNLVVSGYTTPVNIGDKCHVTVSFDYVGPATTQTLYAAIGHVDPIIGFNELVTGTVAVGINAAVAQVTLTATVDITMTSATPASGSPYSVYAKIIGGMISPIIEKVITVTSPTAPTLTVTPTTINSGGTLSFAFTNFTPNAVVTLNVGTPPITVTANASGAGSGSFVVVLAAGSYTLKATDTTGKSATATFTITTGPARPNLIVSPTTLKTGETLTYTLTNFTKNADVTVEVVRTGVGGVSNSFTIHTDATGGYTAGLTVNGTPDLYVLNITDAAGNSISAQFILTENITGLTINYAGNIPKVAIGYGLQFSATITNADGTTQDVTQTIYTAWKSSDTSKATISNLGSVAGIAVGTVVISATYIDTYSNLTSNQITIQVVATLQEANEPTPYALTIKPTLPANLTVDFNLQFDAYIQYNQTDTVIYHDNTDVHWQSSNPSVATVSANGIVTSVSAGTTQISCVYGGVSSNKVTLTVITGASTANASGQVVNAVAQVGISGVTVQIGSAQVDTDSSGNWTMQNVPIGAQNITYSLTGYVSQTVSGWTIQPGVNNNIGAMTLCAVTGNLINLLASGVTADYWNLLLKDVNGKTISIMFVPLSTTQKIYLPDSFAFPAVFMITAFKYIGVNSVAQVVDWQSIFSTLPNYITTQFTGLGTYVMNFSTGVLTKTG
jgi:hypothetical protein